MDKDRITLRVIALDKNAKIVEIKEQEIPATLHDVGLFLRRASFRDAIAEAMLSGGKITIERPPLR